MKKNMVFDDFTEALMTFLMSDCQVYLPGGGEIGKHNPLYAQTEIKIVLNPYGDGYIHAIGRDSNTIDFRSMDHFRSQDMITPSQRDEINKLTQAKATKIVRKTNAELSKKNKELTDLINKMKELLSGGGI